MFSFVKVFKNNGEQQQDAQLTSVGGAGGDVVGDDGGDDGEVGGDDVGGDAGGVEGGGAGTLTVIGLHAHHLQGKTCQIAMVKMQTNPSQHTPKNLHRPLHSWCLVASCTYQLQQGL